jgi:Asp-tRNA(Asn)/Glu-tRNA(Gln) amidotransferase A subunit family amidase
LFIVTGMVPFAIGSETAGSITYPAARCGVTALRPTFGTVGRTGVMSISESLVIFNITMFFYYTLNVN